MSGLLGDGASCSANANPLRQVDKVFSTDRSLQREFQAPQAHQSSFRTNRPLAAADQQMMMQPNMDAFRFDEMRHEVPKFDQGRAWSQEFGMAQPQMAPQMAPQAGSSAQMNAPQMNAPQMNGPQMNGPQTSGPQMNGPQMNGLQEFSQMPMMQRPFVSRMGYRPYMQDTSMNLHSSPMNQMGQQAPEAQWEEQFERAAKAGTQEAEDTKTEEKAAQNETQADEEAAQTAQEAAQDIDLDADTQINMDSLDKAAETDDWTLGSYPPNWEKVWDSVGPDGEGRVHGESFRTTTGEYEFQKENEYRNEEDPFALGVYMMDNGAKLSSAVLCFEEAVRRDPAHVEAWARLGDAQAQNEIEDMAIVALERACALNPQHPRALINLAISYTNEGYDMAASQLLERWLTARYPDIAELTKNEFGDAQGQTLDEVKTRITRMFLRAAQRSQQTVDADVQVGLGVLFYRDEDYSKAIDCFRAALDARPNDASLWNRLGATLANSSQPEEAIESYSTALSLRPSFVRARYNLAVSCINIGCYKEAADHILSAMALHETEENQIIDFDRSANLLDTLRRVFFAMDRRDLLAKLQPGVSLGAFRDEFTF